MGIPLSVGKKIYPEDPISYYDITGTFKQRMIFYHRMRDDQ